MTLKQTFPVAGAAALVLIAATAQAVTILGDEFALRRVAAGGPSFVQLVNLAMDRDRTGEHWLDRVASPTACYSFLDRIRHPLRGIQFDLYDMSRRGDLRASTDCDGQDATPSVFTDHTRPRSTTAVRAERLDLTASLSSNRVRR